MAMARLTSGTPDLTRATDLVKRSLDPLLADPFLSGNLIEDIAVTAAVPFVVTHGLGRAWRGYMIVRSNVAQTVYESTTFTPTPNPNAQLALVPSATGTISLRVF